MNVKQFLCAGMTGALLVAGLTACAPGAPEVDPSDVAYQTAGVTRDTVLFTVDGTEVTADEYLFWLLQSVASAKQSGYLADDDAWEEELNGVPTAEYLKEDARNTSVLYTTVSNHAAAAGLTVTEEEQAEADAELETLTQRVDSYYGMTLQEYLDQQCISEAAFRKLNQVPYLARSLQTQMEEAGELTAQDADLDAMVEEAGYYKAKHILLAFPENEDGSAVTDEQKAAVKAEADQLLAQIRTAADPLVEFDKVMNERSEDGTRTTSSMRPTATWPMPARWCLSLRVPPRPWPWVRSASRWRPTTATTSFCARTLPTRSASSSGTAWRPSTPITP